MPTSSIPSASAYQQQSTRPLQLLNQSASPYVALTPALTPALISPDPPPRTTLPLSSSQHTLKTLVGGRYYDEYDEDDNETTPPPLSPIQPPSASFPPSTSISSTPSSSLGRSQSHAVKAHIINFNTINNTPYLVKNLKRHSASSALPPKPAFHHRQQQQQQQQQSSSLPSSLLPSDRPHRPFNISLPLHDWNQSLNQKPLLAFCLKAVALALFCGLLVFSLVWTLLPPIDQKDLHILRIPTSFEALKKLNSLLQVYKTANYYRVLSSFVLIYLFLQAFSLPGSMYLSILAGAMFGVKVALPLVCLCVGTGALLCYMMSLNLASSLVVHLPSLRSRLEDWKLKLSTKTNRLDLFAYLVVIRISPLPPHWVVNLLAPHVGIRLGVFWLTTCLGIFPVTLIHTQLGTTLDQMVGPEDLSFLTAKNLTGLTLVALGVLVPVLIRWYLRKPHDSPSASVSTVESRPFSARIGLSLQEEEEEEHDDDDLPQDPLGRRHGFRSLSGHTYDNSSFTSLHKLSRVESNETLLLSTSPPDHLAARPSPRQYSLPPSSKTSRLSRAMADERSRHINSIKNHSKETDIPLVDQDPQDPSSSIGEIKFATPPYLTNIPKPHSNLPPPAPAPHHHLRHPIVLSPPATCLPSSPLRTPPTRSP
ncbi:hypothetical protein VP01_2783g2 [Puccinia sorghi]|uniref:VTT domain-containing protein n=1 Tax=Puccinia sorghi TaxID=27349 RepID=A0A0L6V3E7_9BASI|nr:hypothetical protein VP01_2783g2 [Puccinia sorghi]